MQFETAMVKEPDQVLQEGALRAATLAEITGLTEAELMQQRWVLTWKRDDSLPASTRKAKGRLAILGFQHPDLTRLATAAPTVSRLGKHVCHSIMALHELTLEAADASSAFLQTAECLEKGNLFIRPTAEVAWALGIPPRHEMTVARSSKASTALRTRHVCFGWTYRPSFAFGGGTVARGIDAFGSSGTST